MIYDSTFSAPIPGQSLTTEPKNFPWEQPPKFVDPEEAARYIWGNLIKEDTLVQIFYFLENQITVKELAKLILTSGFQQGLWTYDLGVILFEVTCHMIEGIALKAKLKYEYEPPKQSPVLAALTMKKLETTAIPDKIEKEIEALPDTASNSGAFFSRGQ